MKTNYEEVVSVTTEPFVPFVNEECGDTMWEAVLSEMEKNNTSNSNQ